jgi:hypothetical protein
MALKDQIRKRIAAPPTDPPEERGSGITNGTYQTNKGDGYRNGFDRRRKRKSSSDKRSSLFIGIAVVMIGTVLSLVLITTMTRYFSSSSSSSSMGGGGECIESIINGVPRNIYTWCYKNQSRRKLGRSILSLGSGGVVERIVRDKFGKNVANNNPKELIAAINSHEHLTMNEIVAEDQDELCWADFSKPKTIEMTPTIAVRPVVGPCNYEYPKFTAPREGYEDGIDYFFFRDVDKTKFSDELICFNECLDRVLVDPNVLTKSPKNGEKSMSELQPNDKVAVDNIMLIEAARAGLTLTVEKLMVRYSLDPLYRQVRNDPGNGRSLNSIQEAIRGGYAEIVKVLTNGDNSVIIDDYGRSVEDYVKMKGSPITLYDAKHVLGIEAGESGSRQQRGSAHRDNQSGNKSGWNETTANPVNDYCDFDVVDGDLSAEIFYRDYFIPGRPVSMRGQASDMELNMFSKKRWKKTKKFNPDHFVQVGPLAYPSLTGQESCSEEMTIQDMENGAVCEDMPDKPMLHALHPISSDFEELYPAYDGDILDSRGGFRTIKKWFPFIAEKTSDLTWQVFFGGDGSGATYHWHEAAFNILYVGTKEWKVAPPLYRGWSGMTAEKASNALDENISLSCIQRAGDLLYIPTYWGHNTFNHGFTIGAAAILPKSAQMGGKSMRGLKLLSEENDNDDDNDDNDDDISDLSTKDPTKNSEEKVPFLFVHINKTGGTSLIRMFGERCEEEYDGGQWRDGNNNYHRAFHATAHAYIDYYGRKTWNDAYTFAVVRHPLARQVSNFFFLASSCQKNADKCEERLIPTLNLGSMSDEEKMDAFHEWILKVYKTYPPDTANHYRFGAAGHGNEVYNTFSSTQTSWLVDPDGKMVVKEIFHLEDLSNDISKLAENIPCLKSGPLEMDHSNKTPNYPDYMLFAKNKQTRSIINEVFAEDFKILGYKPV